MKPTLVPGLTATCTIRVDGPRAIGFMGDGARVYATPALVRDIEVAARDLLLAHLDPGQDSVGTRVEVDHLAATPLGLDVEITVSVASVAGKAVTLEVSARDALDLVCRGRHQRYVVDVAATAARVAAKAQRAGLPRAAADD